MSAIDLVYGPGSGSKIKDLERFFQLPDRSRLTDKEINMLIHIKGAFAFHKIDDETAIAIMQSFEGKYGKGESVADRLSKFDKFLSKVGNRQDLIDSVKSLGMLSKEEIESQAQENGDWISVIKRTDADNKRKEERDNQENETRSQAVIQQMSHKQ